MTGEIAGKSLLERVSDYLAADLLRVEEVIAAELDSSHPYVRDIIAHVSRFRGKRLRPVLVLLSGKACGGISPAHHVIAAVLEMIHAATLVHDDVLDEADTRRHVATVNTRWNNETSVLFGDYLFTHAFHLASSLESTHACRTIGHSTNVVCEGELTQIKERGNFDLTEEEYLRIVEGKTAELCAVACRLGAEYAGAARPVGDALERYGRSVGVAFQIADDLLDLLGSEAETGKSLGSDIDKQKLTLPLIRLLEQAGPAEGTRIRELLAQPGPQQREELSSFLRESDALEYTRLRAAGFVHQARICLAELPDSRARAILMELAEFTTQRAF